MSAYAAVAAAFRYGDKESLLLRQAIQVKEGKGSGASAVSQENTQGEVQVKIENTKTK